MKANIESITVNGEKAELKVVEVQGLAEKQQQQVKIKGNIDSALRFLEKRYLPTIESCIGRMNQVDGRVSHVLISRDEKTIELIFNETDPYVSGYVSGSLVIHPDFEKWKINTGESWGHQTLAEFCKMNRSLFPDPSMAMKLFKELKDIKIKAEKEFENSNDNRGNVRLLAAQKVISSNIPDSFRLKVPIYKGQAKSEFEVEVYVDASSYAVTLISPQANDIVQEVLDNIIDEQKKAIQELCPDLVIIEK